ncbi:hypothetical protein PG991_001796 [Apiospora marii]|uniref:Uncharacterized protein n=1 Tax=Apiospora marii TaxID=335849 RepID=A0ABR1SN09_9PEZI
MAHRRLSQNSIELSEVSTSHSSMTYHSSTIHQSQDLLIQPSEHEHSPDVSVNEDDDTPDRHDSPSTTPANRQGRRFWRRIGNKGLVMIPLSSLLLLAAIAFLQFLWFQARKAQDGKEPHKLWQTIVFRDWLTRTVTITAVLMRSVVTAQAAIVAPMVAAIIVESSVHIAQLPILSIARAVYLSPTSLAMPVYTNARTTSKYLYSLLVITICLLTLGGQFISTLLLSDFQDTSIASPPIFTMHTMGSSWDAMPMGKGYQQFWTQAPPAFWRFAEHHVPNFKTIPNMVDTGITLRAVIPWLDEKSRLDLRFYAGKALTWDARVVCFSPSLRNASFASDGKDLNVQGALAYNATYPPLKETGYGWDPTNCTTSWSSTISVCRVDHKFTTDPSLAAPPFEIGDYNTYLNDSDNFLVLRLSVGSDALRFNDVPKFKVTFADDQTFTGWSIRRDGPWTVAFNSSGDQMFALSYCCTTPAMYYLDVIMNGTSGGSEPTIKLLPSTVSLAGDDNGVADRAQLVTLRRQLGATLDNLTPQDRGILSLKTPNTSHNRPKGILEVISEFLSSSSSYHAAYNFGRNFDPDTYSSVHKLHKALFVDIMNDTGNPALALQAFSTTLNQMKYYESSYRWTDNNSITYITSESMSIPVGRAGFMSVIAIVAVHLGILAVTSVLFIQRTKATLIGDPWQSIAQVVSDDTLPILSRTDGMEDKKDKYMPNVTGNIQQRQNGRTEFGVKQE